MNPEGYMCENTIIEVKELQFTDQVRCYNTTEEVCSMVSLKQRVKSTPRDKYSGTVTK